MHATVFPFYMVWRGASAMLLGMALTNYLMHTVICSFIFYGYGFALFGSVPRVGQAGITLAIWILQLWLAPLWLDRFRFGPMEWLWRSLSYLERQSFKRH